MACNALFPLRAAHAFSCNTRKGKNDEYDDDEIWKATTVAAQQAVDAAQAQIAKRSRELGIPKQFAPSISFGWHGRGQNGVKERRAELRTMAKAEIALIEKRAATEIEKYSVECQTKLVADGLTSEAGQGDRPHLARH